MVVPATRSVQAIDGGEDRDGDGTTPYTCADSKNLIRAQSVHLKHTNHSTSRALEMSQPSSERLNDEVANHLEHFCSWCTAKPRQILGKM